MNPRSASELRTLLERVVALGESALATLAAAPLDALRVAIDSIADAVLAVEGSRRESFQITSDDERALMTLVNRAQRLFTHLASVAAELVQPICSSCRRQLTADPANGAPGRHRCQPN